MKPFFADGNPWGTADCLGGLNEAANWGDITFLRKCKSAEESSVTNTLQALSEVDFFSPSNLQLIFSPNKPDSLCINHCIFHVQTPIDASNIDSVVADVERMTSDSESLTSTDLIHVSVILENIAESPAATTRVSGSSVCLPKCQIQITVLPKTTNSETLDVHFCRSAKE